jgi:hypothetical protein
LHFLEKSAQKYTFLGKKYVKKFFFLKSAQKGAFRKKSINKIEYILLISYNKMNAIYVIIENGEPYNVVYQTFESAVAVVKAKHKETIDEQLKEANGYDICSELDTPEDKVTGKTYLYVEKGVHIYIYKLPVAF